MSQVKHQRSRDEGVTAIPNFHSDYQILSCMANFTLVAVLLNVCLWEHEFSFIHPPWSIIETVLKFHLSTYVVTSSVWLGLTIQELYAIKCILSCCVLKPLPWSLITYYSKWFVTVAASTCGYLHTKSDLFFHCQLINWSIMRFQVITW